DEYYGRRGALNLGFGWDRTQNVLYRLAHGEFDGQTPRLIVLLIGTNNLTGTEHARANTPVEIAAGVAAIHALLEEASPVSRILLLGIFPRSTPEDPLREKIRETNVLLRRFAAEADAVDFIDFGDRFQAADGTIPTALMADSVHPTEAGYRVWAEAIEPIVARALGERA
ncbi:MAG TPA: GDSL-type esterase/lipase family protein, partial [Armatimonadota bacterium]|nr:GDSL-type esterase/lipase family protein [Armatimonadota bacterium]